MMWHRPFQFKLFCVGDGQQVILDLNEINVRMHGVYF